MWIFLGIVFFIAALVAAILLLPIYIIIKNDDDDNMIILYKILFKTFGENPNPNNPIVKAIKKSSGISHIEKQTIKKSRQESGVLPTVSDTIGILIALFKEIFALLKYCTIKKVELNIVCTGEDAAAAAINYGEYCSLAYPLVGLLCSTMKVREKGQNINIRCDYEGDEDIIRYDFLLSVRLGRVLAAFIRTVVAEVRRTIEANNISASPQHANNPKNGKNQSS